MPRKPVLETQLPELVQRIVDSYYASDTTHHIDRKYLPSRRRIVDALQMLLELVYPGYFGRQHLTRYNVTYHVGDLLPRIAEILHHEIYHSFSYHEVDGDGSGPGDPESDGRAEQLVIEFVRQLPAVRELLAADVRAAYDGDPAAVDTAEIILCYPGVLAVTVYRLAHALHELGVPWVPRVMTEWAHGETGIDIHPGARIGKSFFIDHGTGVVIGETAEIGENVKIYQGVTLGALSFPKDERGRLIRGYKRHPTVLNGVTLYANAIVLGGETTVGANSVVGGSVFLTSSIPDGCTVTIKPPELKVKRGRGSTGSEDEAPRPVCLDYQI